MIRIADLAICGVLLGCCAPGWTSQPPRFNYQAKLSDNTGAALSGTHNLTFWIYEGGSAGGIDSGVQEYKETVSVSIQNGIVNHAVGSGVPVGPVLATSVFKTNADLYLQVAVDGDSNVVLPRQLLESVPFAISSADGEARIPVDATNTPGNSTNTLVISQPGSYYLTSNITGESGKNGISIQSNDVTLDLNGFALIAGGSALRGINVPVPQSNISIRNGSVRGWAGGGVRAEAAVALVEKLRAAGNGDSYGVAVGNGSMIKDCVASGNGTGFYAPDRTEVISCISTVNNHNGFECTSYVTIADCTSSRNGNGVSGVGDGTGFYIQNSCTLIRCGASRNTVRGIDANSNCTIADCTVALNDNSGIIVNTGCTVRGCTISGSGDGGLAVTTVGGGSRCQIIGNTVDNNGVFGIYVFGSANRIEGNTSTLNGGDGFQIAGTHNIVVRNTARGNSTNDFNILGSNNAVGTVFDVTAGGTISASEPWCNFKF